jgi:flavin reductase (DIM6/NTAB) family NADH-FMN oxidoreductase RutF
LLTPRPSDLVDVPLPKAYKLVNHGPVTVLSTFDGKVHNAAPVAWLMSADFDPPLFVAVISSGQKTHKDLIATGECVINVPVVGQVDLVRRLGSTSGNDAPKLENEPLFASEQVGAAKIAGCSAWIEAKLEEVISPAREVYLLRGVHAMARRSAVSDRWQYDVAAWPTLHHLGAKVFAVCDSIV